MKAKLKPVCIALGLGLVAIPVVATTEVIPSAFEDVAQRVGIPAVVLYTLGLIETGRDIQGVGRRPYPWVLGLPNRESAEWFGSESETLFRLRELIAQGETNIDIGLMQINWHWHSKRFRDPADAVNPYRNLSVAADILKEQWLETHDLWQAVGRYHSKTIEHSQGYRERYGRLIMRTILKLEGKSLEPQS